MQKLQTTFVKSTISNAIRAALLVSTALSSQTLYAEDVTSSDNLADIEVVTVLGDFRQQSLQNIPSSLTVLTTDDIELRNAQNLEEIIAAAPNVNFASGSQRARYYQIRGIGERSQFKEPINPSVGVIIDDVDFTGIGSVSSMFDVSQAEVFRGPQGTRFGANALAGLINITTNAPTPEFEGRAKLTAGNYDSYGAGLALSGPASSKANYRLAVEKYQSNGFIDNTFLNTDDTNNRDELTVRSKLAIEVTDHLNMDVGFYFFDFDNGYDAFSLDNTRETMSDNPGFDAQITRAITQKLNYTGFKAVDVVGIFSYANSDLSYGYDEDWSYEGLHPWEYASEDHYFRDKTTSTAELRFLSKPGDLIFANTTSWVAGIYYKKDEEDLAREYTYLPADYFSDFETQNIAMYGQLDSALNDKLTLTAGLRVEYREADYSNSDGLVFDPNDTMVGGKVVLAYQQTDDILFYGSINRGYKSGGVNTDGTLPENLREFDPEYLWNYEVGYKLSFLNDAANLRVAAFYMDRNDVQVKSAKSLSRPDGSAEFITYLGNAAEGTNKGIEIDGNWQINNTVELYASLGLLDTELDKFINAEGDDLSGRDQAHAPNYQYNLGLNIYLTDEWFFTIGLDGRDEFYFSDSHDQQSDAATLLNASLSYSKDNWLVKMWGRNLTDEEVQTRGFYFGNDPRDGYEAKPYYQYGEPLVFGVSVDYQF